MNYNHLILLIVLLVIAGMLNAEACEVDNSFGCVVWKECYPCEGGYCWIRGKK
jgi:hypothetical protein